MSDINDTRIDIDSQIPPPIHIDACTFSPDGCYLATYSATEGVITVWNVATLEKKGKKYNWQNNDSLLKPRAYRVEKTSFNSSNDSKQMMSDVDFTLANKGKVDSIFSKINHPS